MYRILAQPTRYITRLQPCATRTSALQVSPNKKGTTKKRNGQNRSPTPGYHCQRETKNPSGANIRTRRKLARRIGGTRNPTTLPVKPRIRFQLLPLSLTPEGWYLCGTWTHVLRKGQVCLDHVCIQRDGDGDNELRPLGFV